MNYYNMNVLRAHCYYSKIPIAGMWYDLFSVTMVEKIQ